MEKISKQKINMENLISTFDFVTKVSFVVVVETNGSSETYWTLKAFKGKDNCSAFYSLC